MSFDSLSEPDSGNSSTTMHLNDRDVLVVTIAVAVANTGNSLRSACLRSVMIDSSGPLRVRLHGCCQTAGRHSPPTLSWRRQWQAAVPDGPIVELNDHAIRRIDRTFIKGINPDPACWCKPVRPCPCSNACFGQKIERRSVLRDLGGSNSPASLNAGIDSREVGRLSRCTGSRERSCQADD